MTTWPDLANMRLIDFSAVADAIPRLGAGDTFTLKLGPLNMLQETVCGTNVPPTPFITPGQEKEMVNNRDIVQHILDTTEIDLAEMAGWANDLGRVAKQMYAEKMIEEEYGPDDYKSGDVIRFDYQFVEDGTRYMYAAIKVRDLWYTTGPRSPKGYSWTDLCRWWSEAYKVSKISLMKKVK